MTSDNHSNNNKLKAVIAVLSFLSSLIFAGLGFFAIPIGAIEPSVLVFTAELFLFCSMCLGFSASDNAIMKEILEIMKEIKSN